MNTEYKDQSADAGKRRVWNHQPPIIFSALFEWPPRPKAALLALTKRWVTLTRNLLFLLFALVVYNFLLPELSVMTELSLGWIGPIYLRNIVLMMVIAGGLHLYLFTFRAQGKQLKYDPREKMEKSRKFSFRHQVYDNMFWSLVSGVSVWTGYEVLYLWGAANGIIPTFSMTDNPIGVILWMLLLPLVLSSHFYFIHRLLHWPPLFKHVHRLHHRNIHIGPWSGMAMHPIEHILYISSVLVHFVIPTNPAIVILHLIMRSLAPAFSHAGFEKLIVSDKEITDAADFHHQLHHRFFECNYGNVDTPWDKWFGSFHDGSAESTAMVQARRKKMYQAKSAVQST